MRIDVGDLCLEDRSLIRILDFGFQTFDVEAFGFRIVEFSDFDFGLRMSLDFRGWGMVLKAVPGWWLLVYGVTFEDCGAAIFVSAAAMQGEHWLTVLFIDSFFT